MTRQILEHLWKTCGDIAYDMLRENIERMTTPWSPPTPIETIFTQLKTCKRFISEGNDTITDTHALKIGVQIIENNSIFNLACRKWHIRTYASCPMTVFRTHSRKVEKGVRLFRAFEGCKEAEL